MMNWLAPTFVAAVGILVIVKRKELARGEGLVFGGSINPGCVVAQAVVLLLLAAAMLLMR